MKKITQTIMILIAFMTIGKSQDCYNVLADMSGFNTEPYQTQLETAACELIQAFPSEFQDKFKVYDFGFYSLTENFQGGFQAVWDNKVIPSIESPYYLLFGKQSDKTGMYTKFWLALKLPNSGNFECYTETQYNLLQNTILAKVEEDYLKSGKIPSNYANAEVAGMNYLKQRIIDMVDCCQPTLRNPDESCNGCPKSEDILTFYQDGTFDEYDIEVVTDDFGIPIELEPLYNDNIEDFAVNLYELDGNIIDPFSEVAAELDNLGLGTNALGIILNNYSLCDDPTVPTFRSSNSEALSYFDSDFVVSGKVLVIVYHIWQNPDGSGDDKLFTKFLRANDGELEEIDIPLNPTNIGVETESDYNYPLTDTENCDSTKVLYEVIKDENGIYYGYELVNCVWEKRDVVEFIEPDPYPANPSNEQYQTGAQINPTVTYTTIMRPDKMGTLRESKIAEYTPCKKCYEYSVGSKMDISTNDLMRGFYGWYEMGWTHQAEKDILFNSFVYGKGQPVVWNTESSISEDLSENERVQGNITRIESEIREWVEQNSNLDGLINSNSLTGATHPNPNFTKWDLPSLWPTEMFGGIQGRSVKIVRFQQKYSPTCLVNKKIICEFVYTLYDNFGLDSNEGTWYPGMPEQWVLQHYRNGYCCGYQAFSPVIRHQVEFHHSFEICIQ